MNTKNIIKSIFLFVLGIIALMMPFTICLADAGYSSSYSGGGYSGGGSSYSGGSYSSGGSFSSSSWDSGSGIDYDRSGYGSSTSSGEFGAAFIFFVSIVVFFILMISVLSNSSIGNTYYNSPNQNSYLETNDVKKINFLTQEEVDKIDSSINTQEIMKYVFDLFVKESMDEF